MLIFLFFLFAVFFTASTVKSKENKYLNITSDYLKKGQEAEYIIVSGEVLLIDVSTSYLELFSSNTVNGEGIINLKYIGKFYVRSLTIKELNYLMKDANNNFLKFPRVQSQIRR